MSIDNYYVSHTKSDNQIVFESHLHDYFELYLVLSENAKIKTEYGYYKADYGDFFVFAPFSFHKIVSDSRFERCLITFSEYSVIKESACLKKPLDFIKREKHMHFTPTDENVKKLINLFDNAMLQKNNNDIMSDFYKIRTIGEILSIIINSPFDNNVIAISQNNKMSQIMKYVYENAEYGITANNVCKKFNIGATSLYTLFKNNFDISPGEYIIRLKINKASELLKSGSTVTEAANMSGFNSYSHFIRIFKKRTGISPHKFSKCQ